LGKLGVYILLKAVSGGTVKRIYPFIAPHPKASKKASKVIPFLPFLTPILKD
jgi:hypothetical protein